MHLRLDRYTSPLSVLLVVTDEEGALRALEFADHESRCTACCAPITATTP